MFEIMVLITLVGHTYYLLVSCSESFFFWNPITESLAYTRYKNMDNVESRQLQGNRAVGPALLM